MHTKTPITLRVEPALLAAVRDQAHAENRTLTNFIETVLKERLAALRHSGTATLSVTSTSAADRGAAQ